MDSDQARQRQRSFERCPERYFNRELSWLAFNERVLAEAPTPLPAARAAALPVDLGQQPRRVHDDPRRRARRAGAQRRRATSRSTARRRRSSSPRSTPRCASSRRRSRRSCRDLRRLLAAQGIHIASLRADRRRRPSAGCSEYFLDHIMPVITPQAIDPAHPFPFVANQGIGALFNLTRAADGSRLVEMVLIPSAIPRFVRVPGERGDLHRGRALVCRFAALLFPGFRVEGDGVFRVLRDSDIEIEEEAEDLVRYLPHRDPAAPARPGDHARARRRTSIRGPRRCCASKLGLEQAIVDQDRRHARHQPAWPRSSARTAPTSSSRLTRPRYPERVLEHDGDCFAAIREKDIVIHHPYESFEVVVDFLRQAAADPAVVSIKQTLYRAGNQSPVIAALIAGGRGGQVGHRGGRAQGALRRGAEPQVGERARTRRGAGDLRLRRLEDPRQGLDGRAARGRRLPHLLPLRHRQLSPGDRARSTPTSASSPPIPRSGATRASCSISSPATSSRRTPSMLAISPLNLRETLYELIDREIANAAHGRPAAIWAKLNALTEKGVIDRLYEASQAGVQIVLVVRGICCLRPGMPGLSETIIGQVDHRPVPRAQPHLGVRQRRSRCRTARRRLFISSADAMSRSLNRRVEVLVPIRNATVHDQVLEQVLLANLLDTEQSWLLDGEDGSYERVEADGDGFNCHDYFMTNPSLSGRGGALAESRGAQADACARARPDAGLPPQPARAGGEPARPRGHRHRLEHRAPGASIAARSARPRSGSTRRVSARLGRDLAATGRMPDKAMDYRAGRAGALCDDPRATSASTTSRPSPPRRCATPPTAPSSSTACARSASRPRLLSGEEEAHGLGVRRDRRVPRRARHGRRPRRRQPRAGHDRGRRLPRRRQPAARHAAPARAAREGRGDVRKAVEREMAPRRLGGGASGPAVHGRRHVARVGGLRDAQAATTR